MINSIVFRDLNFIYLSTEDAYCGCDLKGMCLVFPLEKKINIEKLKLTKLFSCLTGIKIIDKSSEKPIKALPFIAFDLIDRTAAADDNKQKYNVGWKRHISTPRSDLPRLIYQTTDKSFLMQAQGPSIKPDTEVKIEVSLFWNK